MTIRSQNCQEYTRTLSSDLSPGVLSALSVPTSLILIGCGSHDLIPTYKRETSTPFPVYADPSRKLYDVLGMIKTLSLGDKSPRYMRQPVLKLSGASFLQALKSGRNMLSGGDFWQVGGEFIIQSDGTSSWCHRMKNTRDHAEVDELRKALQTADEPEPAAVVALGKPIGSRRSMSGAGLVRKLSDRRKSWRNSMSRSQSRNTEANGSVSRTTMEKLKEEDGAPQGDRDAALAKLTHTANEKDILAAEQTSTDPSKAQPSAKISSAENLVGSSVDKPVSNGSLHNSTPFVQSLMNGSLEKGPDQDKGLTNGSIIKDVTSNTEEEASRTTNGHIVET